MPVRIEVFQKENLPDRLGETVLSEIHALGIKGVREVRVVEVYLLEGRLSGEQLEKIGSELLADTIVQDFAYNSRLKRGKRPQYHTVEVVKKPGVMDPVEATTLQGIADMGLKVEWVKRARKYLIRGELSREELETIASKILANNTIEDVFIEADSVPHERKPSAYNFHKVSIPLREASRERLLEISRQRQLSLSLEEMQAIQRYYQRIGREPTDAELETLAQTWSEHCMHKTLRGHIEYQGELIDNLLGSTIMRATRELRKPWCVSVFQDNAGIIEFDGDYGICFKVETHNHPSALEPYGGASTGLGGVIRDILGCGLGARPILNTDVFCFARPDLPYSHLPKGVLHPRRVFKGVVQGVRDYGNRMGIPTVNGAIYFDDRYVANPLVFCGTVGLIPRNRCKKKVVPGDAILLVGGRTGRDGLHGATFSSAQLTEDSEVLSGGAVQIGNPITEKKLLDLLLVARDKNLYHSITDCGAGGLSSAVGEMGKDTGAEVDLEKVPLKYSGLSYWEIWLSEAQERMVLAVPPKRIEEIVDLFHSEGVEATVIGRFTRDKRLHLMYQGHEVGGLEMDFLHKGLPRPLKKAHWAQPQHTEPNLPKKRDYTVDLKRILSSWNVCSKEWVIRQYDHEVQGGCVLKPLQGVANDGPGDACIVTPVLGSRKGIIVSCGMNPKYGDIDPYHMAASAIDEALRQIISVGGDLSRVALLDNFSWGNTDLPDQLGALVRAALACYHMALYFGTPFISGKDSLNNEFRRGDTAINIPPTLLISALAVMEDVGRAVSMDAKEPGNLIYIAGLTKEELGGSHYYSIHGHIGNSVPKVDAHRARKTMEALSRATSKGLVRACHDCSEGGLAVAAAEMSFAGGLGMELGLGAVPIEGDIKGEDTLLFSESNSRFLVEVRPQMVGAFEKALKGIPYGLLGKVKKEPVFVIKDRHDRTLIHEGIYSLKEAWQSPLSTVGAGTAPTQAVGS
ncbi:MAG: phosphoribosylformylglycinamidine synthase II [Planctomycetes bacterium RIFCSPHIGHO2_12_FULL_52_36]|nr:MAG: phosphoribosylformylglycinamidine synthase II [Planctomycetes bacterium RIFCSPHIGHO2_12_FULL_52_36]